MIVKSLHRPVARLAAGALFIAAGLTAFAGIASAAGGNNGDVKLGSNGTFTNSNDPHLQCPIFIQWSGFDTTQMDDFTVAFSGISPTGGTVTAAGPGVTPAHHQFPGPGDTEQYNLSFAGATAKNGEFHVGIDITTTDANGSQFKQKTVWVSDCGHDLGITKSGTTTGVHPGDAVVYHLHVTNNSSGPTTGPTTVTDHLPNPGILPGTISVDAGSDGTWTCTVGAAQNPTCTTNSVLNPGDSADFTVNATIDPNVAPLPTTLTDNATVDTPGDADSSNNLATLGTDVTAAGGPAAPNAGVTKNGPGTAWVGQQLQYDVVVSFSGGATTGTTTVTDTLPNGLDPGLMTFVSGDGTWTCGLNASTTPTCSAPAGFTAGQSATFHVTTTANAVGPQTDSVSVVTTGDSDNSDDSATKTTTVSAASALGLQPQCDPATAGQVLWTVTNPSGNPDVSGLTVSGSAAVPSPTTLSGGQQATFHTAAPSGALSVSGTAFGQTVSSNSVSFSNQCTTPPPPGETPASAVFTDTCSGFHAVFTSASLHTTQFVVNMPIGGNDTVSGSGTRDYPADATHSHISVTYDGVTQTADWVEPAGCTQIPNPPPAVADPTVSASNACKTGITVNLGNMNGTAPVTFTVTAPDNTVDNVSVLAGQIVKKSYAVVEDTTGTVTVSAPGLATKKFTYAKNCTAVLGEKVTKTPTPKPTPTVQGEKVTRLPFTGSNTSMFLTLAALFFAGGVVLMAFGARRRPEGKHL